MRLLVTPATAVLSVGPKIRARTAWRAGRGRWARTVVIRSTRLTDADGAGESPMGVGEVGDQGEAVLEHGPGGRGEPSRADGLEHPVDDRPGGLLGCVPVVAGR